MPDFRVGGVFARDLKYFVPKAVSQRRSRKRQHGAVLLGLMVVVSVSGLGLLSIGSDDPQAALPTDTDAAPTAGEWRMSGAAETAPNETAPNTPPPNETTKPLATRSEPAQALDAPADTAADSVEWIKHRIAKGETLSSIFKKRGLSTKLAFVLGQNPDLKQLTRLRAGRELRLALGDGKLVGINYDLGHHRWMHVEIGDTTRVTEVKAKLERRERYAYGAIKSSLFHAGAEAGLSDKLMMALAGVFGWDIDFALDLQPGDEFRLIYEELFDEGRPVGDGDILAAEFRNRDRRHHAFRFVHEDGRIEYYDLNGRSLRGTFLRTPVKFSRITSKFSHKRFHPILKKWRSHKGVDYGAPRGTPVLATADGKVSFVGRKGGYGKTVKLRHGGRFSTLYAHLSSYKRGLRTGSRVKQGQIVGFVGSTGLATGPHLHYEFRVAGVHRNPLTYEMPKSNELAQHLRPEFQAQARQFIDRLAAIATTQVASTN